VNDQTAYSADEFESEARYIDTLIWEAVVVVPGAKVLVCGYGPDGTYVQRAIDAGATVTVIEHRKEEIQKYAKLDAKLLRGSTSVIPAKDNSFDLAISFHYLHEIDPFFHAQVLAELARVARRVAVIEPAPPADPLGKRIALLYSQAKRELGQFEYYQPLEYWKKLLQAVKADVSQHVFAFAKTPPRHYLNDTVKLLLDTIEMEDAPREYMEELRTIAQRSDAQLLPPPRYVLVGAAAGDLLVPSFTPRLPSRRRAAIAPPAPAASPSAPAAAKPQTQSQRDVSEDAGYAMPPVEDARNISPPETIEPAPVKPAAVSPAPKPIAPAPQPPPLPAPPPIPSFGMPSPPPDSPFGAPPPANAPFGAPPPPQPGQPAPPLPPGGAPFGMPSWQWEPPEGEEPKP
jgi:hypothetical protein